MLLPLKENEAFRPLRYRLIRVFGHHSEIAAGLRINSPGRISRLIKEGDWEIGAAPLLQQKINRCCELLRASPAIVLQPRGSDTLAPHWF